MPRPPVLQHRTYYFLNIDLTDSYWDPEKLDMFQVQHRQGRVCRSSKADTNTPSITTHDRGRRFPRGLVVFFNPPSTCWGLHSFNMTIDLLDGASKET
mmetsp:Transcript_32313/g.126578  ORF Transcript_32313/g.126578 Transcript_32313/m.126578 type:complete len:98 (-) Transcript_32313:1624-1917(-)